MSTDIAATGRREIRAGVPYVILERTFAAPIDAVWAAITDPSRMERWIGTWTGDPATGSVDFRMTAEGDDVESERFSILECVPPQRLAMTSTTTGDQGDEVWLLELDLSETDGTTTLVFAQGLPRPESAENVGPGWEYYLDRLVAAESGRDVATIDWDAYYPALSEPYAAMFRD